MQNLIFLIIGGTGIPPTNARTGDGVSLKSEIENPVSQDSNSAQTTFHVKGLPPLTDAYSVKARYDAMRKILDQTYNYHQVKSQLRFAALYGVCELNIISKCN